MGSQKRAFTKINKIINKHIVYNIFKDGIKKIKGIDEYKAFVITEFLFNQPKFLNALEEFEFNLQQSLIINGVAAIKNGIAFIPGFGPMVNIAIDVITKIVPQIIFLTIDAWELKNIMDALNNKVKLLDQADYDTQHELLDQAYYNTQPQEYQQSQEYQQPQEYQPAAVGGRRRRTRVRRRGGTRRAQKRKLKSRRKL